MSDPRRQIVETQALGITALRLDELSMSYHRFVLAEAKTLLASNHNEMSVILGQAAAELCTEWAITALFAARQNHDLAEPILDFFQVKDITNDRVRAIYSVLSKDQPNEAPFWSGFVAHRKLRHYIVHRGIKCPDEEAESSLSVVDAYISHVEAVVSRARKA